MRTRYWSVEDAGLLPVYGERGSTSRGVWYTVGNEVIPLVALIANARGTVAVSRPSIFRVPEMK